MKTYVILTTWGSNRYDYDQDINTQPQVWQDGEGLTANVRKSLCAQGEMHCMSNIISWASIDVLDCATGTWERVFHKKKPLLTRTELNVAAKAKKSVLGGSQNIYNSNTAASLLAAQWATATSISAPVMEENTNDL